MRKRLLRFLSLMMIAAMLLTATPINRLIGIGSVHAEDDEEYEIDQTIKAPGKIGKPSVAKMNKKSYKVTWTKVTKNCKGYILEVSPYKNFVEPEPDEDSEEEEDLEEIQRIEVDKKKTSQKVTDLTKGKIYYVRIRAFNASDEGYRFSKWSKVTKFKAK